MDLISQLNDQKRKVDYNTYDISVKELISMVHEGIIDIAPEYQRQFRWTPDRQSSLIESIFLGIPIPSLYMATNQDGSWELIDGVQRISSIVHFAGEEENVKKIGLDSRLKLNSLVKLENFNNMLFNQLPKSVQLDFLLKPIKVTTLSDKSDLSVRFDLFERLNTGGVSLSDQEIRSCIYRGKFNDFIKGLANDVNYKKAVRFNKKQETDGTREEFVLRFFAFLNNYKNFDHSVVDFLNDYMEKASSDFDYKTNEELFLRTFSKLADLEKGIVRTGSKTPVNLFEGVSAGAALALIENKEIILNDYYLWINKKEYINSITGATNTRSKVIYRIEHSRNRFLGNV